MSTRWHPSASACVVSATLSADKQSLRGQAKVPTSTCGSATHEACAASSAPQGADGAVAGRPEDNYLVNGFTVRRYALDAFSAGVPKDVVRKWVHDLSRDFYVRDDVSFARSWWELRHRWERTRKRRQVKKRLAPPSEESDEAAFPPGASTQDAAPPQERRTCAADADQSSRRKHRRACAGGATAEALCSARAAVHAAKEDISLGRCASYDQALAVRLTLALGTSAAPFFEKLSHSCDGGGVDKATKRLLLLVHPDKTAHPQAKEAFQRLAPVLRKGRMTAAECVGRYCGGCN